jgi:CDP-paratose 2-epimerase
MAAQVAVTTSLSDPIQDFEVNARGTLNLLEAIRAVPEPPPLLYTSSGKIYGALAGLELDNTEGRYLPKNPQARAAGVAESHPLDFHSPYGCSKGAADQYVLDYARMYQLPAGGVPAGLGVRPAPARHRGSGLGRALPPAGPAGRAHHHLWRRPAGA